MHESTELSHEAASNDAREALAEAVAAARGAHEMVEELHAALLEERSTIVRLREEFARLEVELDALRASRLFRYTAGLRAARGSWRRSG
jgi:hypothetical protein